MPTRLLFVCAANSALKRGDLNEHVFREAPWEVRRHVERFVTVARAQAREQHARP